MNKKRVLKLLMLLSLSVAFLLKPATMSGAAIPDHSRAHITSSADKKKNVRKQRALSVLREYLPAYADILEAEMLRFEQVFYNGGSALPITPQYDPRSPFANPIMRLQLMQSIDKWLGTRYRYGGRSARGIDCSGFTSKVYTEALGKTFRGSSRMQARQFTPIFDVDSMQFGDVIFFTGTKRNSRRIGHVGVYLGAGVFAHAATSRGVTFNHIKDGYYERRFRFGGRFISEHAADAGKAGVFASP
ncbi:MAG: C40 family peptidase [Bacteroidota bacterium]|nr:C40 family peptidase [Bacteroidota bacterium]